VRARENDSVLIFVIISLQNYYMTDRTVELTRDAYYTCSLIFLGTIVTRNTLKSLVNHIGVLEFFFIAETVQCRDLSKYLVKVLNSQDIT